VQRLDMLPGRQIWFVTFVVSLLWGSVNGVVNSTAPTIVAELESVVLAGSGMWKQERLVW